jgi:imidazolonepropionase-like amidohydrolase
MRNILLKNCIIYDGRSDVPYINEIFIQGNKIIKVSKSINDIPEKTIIIDIGESYVIPGLIDCHTHLGIFEEGMGKIGIGNNETSCPVTPQLRGIDAINPFDIAFGDAVRSGITTVMSGPGSNNAVGGLSAAIKTYGRVLDKMILRNPVGLKIALGENPLNAYGANHQCPVTRMATAALIRELFMKTQDYILIKEGGNLKERDIKLEAVIPVLKGEISLRVHAHRADDIITAVRIAEEFNIKKVTIEHGTEGHLIKDFLREKNIPVAFGPMLSPRIKMELNNLHCSSAVELVEAGIKLALITDHPYNSIDKLRTIAILAISEGLSAKEAIKCITINPAEILECEKQIGKLEDDYDADIVVFDRNPFDINAKVVMTIINGEILYSNKSKLC